MADAKVLHECIRIPNTSPFIQARTKAVNYARSDQAP